MSKLKFFYGTMNSRKTSELLMLAHSLMRNGIKYLIFKQDIDTRSPLNKVKSRIGCLESPALTIYNNTNIFESVYKIMQELDSDDVLKYILIDESQFLTPQQVEELCKIVDILSVNVFCYGLKNDFMTKMFDGSKRLFELADDIEEVSTICKCGEKATLNGKIDIFGEITKCGEQIEIGGDERYTPLCRKCYGEIIN